MRLELEIFNVLCATENFSINYVEADKDDFGEIKDIDFRKRSSKHGCGNSKFITKEPHPDVLEKYAINQSEYYQVCQELENKLSFGNCNFCH